MTASTYSSSGISKTNPLNNLTRERNYFTKAQFKLFKSSVNDALKPDQPYCTFLETLRSGAHNLMHANIGGELKNQNISSKDPLFFMLHANIDRLWERWITFDNQYPANSEFLNQYFFFIDENGNTVKMRGIQILQTTQQLGYKYSSPGNVNPGSRPQNKCCPTNQPGSRQMLLEQPQAYTTQNQKTKISLSASAISNVDQVINIIKNLNFNQQVYLEIEGINISRLPSPAIYVYLTKTNKLDKKPRLSSFVGALDLSPLSFEGSNPTITARVNVKRLLPALVYSISDLKNLGLILQVEDDKPFTLNFSNIRLVIEER